MSNKSVAQLNAQGDSVVAGSVVARQSLHLQRDGIFQNDGKSAFSQDVQMNSNLLVGQTIFVDNIVQYTTGAGVTVEGVLLHDGMVSATALQGINVNAVTPTDGQVLGFNGANWVPVDAGGIGMLMGDVNGPPMSNTVSSVGGQSAASVASAAIAVGNSTSANVAGTLVARNGLGNFQANVITADLNGNANTVSTVGGQSAASVAAATILANNATNANVSNAIVRRDASGNFQAGTITANLLGNASSALDFTGSLSGDVTGTQSSTVVSALRGTTVSGTSPSLGQVLQFDGSSWAPITLTTQFDPLDPIFLGTGTATSNSGVGSITIGFTAVTSGAGTPISIGYASNTSAGGIALGTNAVSNGNYGIAVGQNSTASNETVSIGHNAGNSVTGNLNVMIGTSVMGSIACSSSNCVGIGFNALTNLTTGNNNTALGSNASLNLGTGSGNLSLGSDAGYNATTASFNTSIGYRSHYNGNGANGYNTCIGAFTGQTLGINGDYNTIVGANANTDSDAVYGTSLGYNAITTTQSVALGSGTNTNGIYNSIAIGTTFGNNGATVLDNAHALALAMDPASVNSSQLGCSINGTKYQIPLAVDTPAPSIAGQVLCFNGTNWQSGVVFNNGTTVLGGGAVTNASTLNQVTGIGSQTLLNAVAGADGNTALGYQAGDTVTTGNNNVLVGNGADVMANMNSYGVAVGCMARTNSRGVAIGYAANTNSIINAIALGENAAPLDADHAIALFVNAASVTAVAPGGGTSYLGININGVNYKIMIVAD